MNLLRPVATILAFATTGGAWAQAAADRTAAEACEAAVTENVLRLRGKDVRDVQFAAARRAPAATAAGDDQALAGEGRYRRADGRVVAFSYGCSYHTESGKTSGVVLRESGSGSAEAAAPKAAELGALSPEACESAAVAVLKSKYPRVDRIVFGSDSRRLEPAENERSSLEGQGAVVRAAGMSAIPFSYRCEVEPRSGRIVAIQTRE
jgi:hypothetical protein